MRRFQSLVVAGFTSALAFNAAQAADPAINWPAQTPIQAPITELSSGWYLRGDIGYRVNTMAVPDTAVAITGQKFDNTYVLGGGVGYKYQWFRADLTVDYGVGASYHGTTASPLTIYGAKIDATTVLANAYFDLGTWSGFSPYLGAGVGTSFLRVSDFANVPSPGILIGPNGKWNFSWAGMAGVAFRVAPNWVIDVGYRYLNLGDAYSGQNSIGVNTRFKNLSAQDIRIGVRFLLD